jgi:glutathione S-transferase
MSSNARRAVMTALHLEADVELVLVDLSKGEQRSPAFLAMNPNGKVPVLEDGGWFLSESHAIMAYLADRTPGQTLYPTETRARADVNRWMFWNAQHFQPSVGILNWERFVKAHLGHGAPDPAEVARGERLVHECARVLDGHLARRDFLVGDALTLADLALAATIAPTAKLPLESYEHLGRWFSRIGELPVWKRTKPALPG